MASTEASKTVYVMDRQRALRMLSRIPLAFLRAFWAFETAGCYVDLLGAMKEILLKDSLDP